MQHPVDCASEMQLHRTVNSPRKQQQRVILLDSSQGPPSLEVHSEECPPISVDLTDFESKFGIPDISWYGYHCSFFVSVLSVQ